MELKKTWNGMSGTIRRMPISDWLLENKTAQ